MKLSQILTIACAFCLSIVASAQPTITIKADTIEGCNPTTVRYSYTTDITPVTSVLWKFGNNLTSTDTNPSTVYDQNGIYDVQLIINANDTGHLAQVNSGCINVPNVFSPNGDNINDYFEVKYDDKTIFNLKVFTRNGTLVYITSGIKISWNGYFDSGEKISQGLYYYNIESVGITPAIKKKGFVYIFY